MTEGALEGDEPTARSRVHLLHAAASGSPELSEAPSETPGERLRRLRADAGLTLSELGRISGMRPSVVLAYEQGRRTPSETVMLRMVSGMKTHGASESTERTEDSTEQGSQVSRAGQDGTAPVSAPDGGDAALGVEPVTADCAAASTENVGDENGSGTVSFEETARADLRRAVLEHLEHQGFKLTAAGVIAPVETDKSKVRGLHDEAVQALRERGRAALARREREFVARLAPGLQVAPSRIRPRLVLIDTFKHADAPLWRWCSLHWSIPVSGGYGRRLRFLVVDEAHGNAVMGLIGLADPVFALGCRDAAIGWTSGQRGQRLTSVMDAFVLGAVPPYSQLLGGKLLAMLIGSREVRDAFADRYGHRTTVIAGRDPDAHLALVTTTSALGRSSVYNRVRRRDGSLVMHPVGFTQGSGDFHFSGAIYDRLSEFAAKHTDGSTHRHERWGSAGFRNRREVIQKALVGLGLPSRALRFHGVQRQVFLNPLAPNAYAYLRGETDHLDFYDESAADISEFWRERWAHPRSQRDIGWLSFDPETWRLYT